MRQEEYAHGSHGCGWAGRSKRRARFIQQRHCLLVDGKWTDSRSGQSLATLNPATEETLAQVPCGNAEDIDRSVQADRRAFADGSPWRGMTSAERRRLIHRIDDLILEQADGGDAIRRYKESGWGRDMGHHVLEN